jgi:anti-sigma-K factor RskA
MNYDRPALLDKLASTYVLGTMAARARPRFACHLATSPRAQRAVAKWHNSLAPLNRSVAPLAPPAGLWAAIAAGTGHPTAPAAPFVRAPRARGWFDTFVHAWTRAPGDWGRAAVAFGLGAIISAALVAFNPHLLGMHGTSASLPASYVGVLSNARGEAVLAAGAHRHGHTLAVKLLKPLTIPPGTTARLWAIPQAGAPWPIANLAGDVRAIIALDGTAELRFAQVPRLGLSFEVDPAAKAPTIPFALEGPCVKFW